MKWDEYLVKFEEVLDGKNVQHPYDDPTYVYYVKLNSSRVNRWLKTGALNIETTDILDKINCHQKWILITEPWCGDAANIAPIIDLMAEYSDKIDFEIELRDGDTHLIDNYLTNGGKSIPILVARDENNKDVFVWGPRPKECQEMVLLNKDSEMSNIEKKSAIQIWYNQDKGQSIQREIRDLVLKSCQG